MDEKIKALRRFNELMIALFRVLLLLAVVAVISDMASGLRRSRTQSSYPFKEGDKVQVEYNGAWWNATVMYYADAGINISYDVGQGETIPSAQIIGTSTWL